MKAVLKKIIPASWLSTYHRLLAMCADVRYGHPSRRMVVIGVTGTKGKSTTSNILWKLLTDAGHTVGLTGTLNYRVGSYEELSTYKMTMLGRFKLQAWLKRMADAGCDIAIVETTSEGIKQWRHIGIAYDIAVFTNLTPEHLEAHGGFSEYKAAKLELFRRLAQLPVKNIAGKPVEKAGIFNMDSEYAQEFAAIGDYRKIRIGDAAGNDLVIGHIQEELNHTVFDLNGHTVTIPLLGRWNVSNAIVAAGAALAVGVPLEQIISSLPSIPQVPGRMEFIDAGQPFTVIVDYAHEPRSLELLYAFWRKRLSAASGGKKLITLISSTGGGRDVARRQKNGAVAAKYCDVVIVTDEDPYDEDPRTIMNAVAEGTRAGGKMLGENMWEIVDRREAIQKACALAGPGDVVIIPCKGAEQKMCVSGGRKIDWDDRQVLREIIHSL
ncbi:MAG: UDP-N-acetylmuramyl-tripeptide synthetase [Candidatus Kerfeldbacteria bacterium]|nr:UDP-N-acetylmuramyl-tripeptide synthetase [Candidatus Kerfeldbacteria bacterium]